MFECVITRLKKGKAISIGVLHDKEADTYEINLYFPAIGYNDRILCMMQGMTDMEFARKFAELQDVLGNDDDGIEFECVVRTNMYIYHGYHIDEKVIALMDSNGNIVLLNRQRRPE